MLVKFIFLECFQVFVIFLTIQLYQKRRSQNKIEAFFSRNSVGVTPVCVLKKLEK
jgi:hypothetical protein